MHDDDSDNDGNVDHNNGNIVYCTRRWCMFILFKILLVYLFYIILDGIFKNLFPL